MLNHDNQQFESRLREFRPLAAEPLPVGQNIPARRRRLVLAMCVAAGMMVVLAAVIARQRAERFHVIDGKVKVVDVVEVHPLTIRSADELLARAPSVKSALDGLAFYGRPKQLPHGKQSTLAVLGKEGFKL